MLTQARTKTRAARTRNSTETFRTGRSGSGPSREKALREDADSHALFGFWIFAGEALADDVESGLCVFQGDSGA